MRRDSPEDGGKYMQIVCLIMGYNAEKSLQLSNERTNYLTKIWARDLNSYFSKKKKKVKQIST